MFVWYGYKYFMCSVCRIRDNEVMLGALIRGAHSASSTVTGGNLSKNQGLMQACSRRRQADYLNSRCCQRVLPWALGSPPNGVFCHQIFYAREGVFRTINSICNYVHRRNRYSIIRTKEVLTYLLDTTEETTPDFYTRTRHKPSPVSCEEFPWPGNTSQLPAEGGA